MLCPSGEREAGQLHGCISGSSHSPAGGGTIKARAAPLWVCLRDGVKGGFGRLPVSRPD